MSLLMWGSALEKLAILHVLEVITMILSPRERFLAKKHNLETAKRMMDEDIPISKIVKVTGLSEDEIMAVK